MSKFKKGDRVLWQYDGRSEKGEVMFVDNVLHTLTALWDSDSALHTVSIKFCTLLLPAPVSGEVLDPWACPKVGRATTAEKLATFFKLDSSVAPGICIVGDDSYFFRIHDCCVSKNDASDIQAQIDDLRQEMEEECEFRDKRIDALAARVEALESRNGISKREAELLDECNAMRRSFQRRDVDSLAGLPTGDGVEQFVQKPKKQPQPLDDVFAWHKLGRGVDAVTATYSVLRHHNLYSALEERLLQLTPYRRDANMPHSTCTIPQSSTPYTSPTFDSLR